MSTEATLEILSKNSGETEAFAEKLSNHLKSGDVIELVSDLGGGKTTFVKGLAKGLGYDGSVSSPSFTILNQYKCPKLTIYHYDFYRLSEPGLIKQALLETLSLAKSINIIEWPESIKGIMPSESYKVGIAFTDKHEDERLISLKADEKLIKSLRLKP